MASSTIKLLRNIALPNDTETVHTEAAILDMGSYSTRIGFAGDNAPRLNQRTCVLSPQPQTRMRAAVCCFDKAYAASTMNHEKKDQRGSRTNHQQSSSKMSSHNKSVQPTRSSSDSAHTPTPHLAEHAGNNDDDCATRVLYRGAVQNWTNWDHMMDAIDDMLQLSRDDPHTPLLLTEKALVPSAQRARMAELLYEGHGLSALSFQLSPVLALYAAGRCSGMSVELGHEQCHVVPVFQGFPLFHATHGLDVGGADLTRLFAQHSSSSSSSTTAESKSSLIATRQIDVWNYLKEMYGQALASHACYEAVMKRSHPHSARARVRRSSASSTSAVAPCSHTEVNEKTLEHVLPDGTHMTVGMERYTAAEALFSPQLLSSHQAATSSAGDETGRTHSRRKSSSSSSRTRCTDADDDNYNVTRQRWEEVQQLPTSRPTHGIHELIVNALQRCDADLMPVLLDHLVLSGGSSLFAGLPERVGQEVARLLPSTLPSPRVVAEVERRQAAFVGGSMIASLPSFQSLWVTRAQYEEEGATAVVRRCF